MHDRPPQLVDCLERIYLDTSAWRLVCPTCRDEHTHVDVLLASNAAGHGVGVCCFGEDEQSWIKVRRISRPEDEDPTRRHTLRLVGECETGHKFSIAFTQHKGTTLVRVGEHGDVDLPPAA